MSDASLRVMVVEDNDFVRMQVCAFLEGDGYEVVQAVDGRSALEQDLSTVDMMIVDLRMEPMGGFEFVRLLRLEGIRVPFVVVTGDNSPDILQEADKEGASAVLMKPLQKDRLLKMVARVLAGAKRGGAK